MKKVEQEIGQTLTEITSVKKTGRGGTENFPNCRQPADGSNAKYMSMAIEINVLDKIDPKDIKQVDERINVYFALCGKYDTKPSVSGLALALGVDRRTLWDWKVENTRSNTHSDSIKKAYSTLEFMWENYMLNGKINPVSGIFLGKNNFGYQDKQEYVLTPNNNMGNDVDPEEVRKLLEE